MAAGAGAVVTAVMGAAGGVGATRSAPCPQTPHRPPVPDGTPPAQSPASAPEEVVEVVEIAVGENSDGSPDALVVEDVIETGEEMMKVLLRSDVDGVGKRGDMIDVSGGFARNHLLPAGKAIVAPAGVEQQAAAMRRSRDLRDARDRESSETVARALVGTAITIAARASGDRLFGSVAAADIVRHVEEQTGAVVDRQDLVLEEPIKTIGEHSVRVELVGGVVFELTVEVAPES